MLLHLIPCGPQVSHDDKGVTSVSFLEGVDVRRPGRVADLLARAMRQRAVGATATNEHSSRSHMVFSLNITGTNAASGQQVHGGPLCMHALHCFIQVPVPALMQCNISCNSVKAITAWWTDLTVQVCLANQLLEFAAKSRH